MSRFTELEVNQQVTADAIREDGVFITLRRRATPAPDGAGGYLTTGDYTPLEPRMRWLRGATLNVRSGNTREFFQDDAGQRYQIKYVLVGPSDDDVREGDLFDYAGQTLRVADVHPDRSFETRAQVVGWSDGDGST